MKEIGQIEQWTQAEYRPGVSAGAAARQLCRMLGAMAAAPTLKRMLEDMLADANVRSHDRHRILDEFKRAAPVEASAARRASFMRINRKDRNPL